MLSLAGAAPGFFMIRYEDYAGITAPAAAAGEPGYDRIYLPRDHWPPVTGAVAVEVS